MVVLTNTEGQNAYAIGRALARAVFGMPELNAPDAAPDRNLADRPVSAAERRQLSGTFLLTAGKVPPSLHDSYAQYRRTYRVFDENGRLMIQPLGFGAERLLKQEDGSFAMQSSSRTRIWFEMGNDRAGRMRLETLNGLQLAGERVGGGDPQTFHRQLP